MFKLRKILERNICTLTEMVLCIKNPVYKRKSLKKTAEELESTIWKSVRVLQDKNIELQKTLNNINIELKKEKDKVNTLVQIELDRLK